MSRRDLLAVAVAAFALLGCATPPEPQVLPASLPPGLGDAKATAIEVCGPPGERAYLDRLQCADGSPAVYRRVGSFGGRTSPPSNLTKEQEFALLERTLSGAPLEPGEADYHVVDGYEVSCGPVKRMIYMDMYHCKQPLPTDVPRGFQRRQPN